MKSKISIRSKTEVIGEDVFKYDHKEKGHNCAWCQPFIAGEIVRAGCPSGCRPDASKRGGDAFHMQSCTNG